MRRKPIRVLIVDDSARARAGLRALLSTWPAIEVVGEAANGQEALQRMTDCQPTIVLLDLHMPLLDGVQTTRRLKAQWPTVSIIIVTMYPADAPAALTAGADGFVIKGDAPERLLAALYTSVTSGG